MILGMPPTSFNRVCVRSIGRKMENFHHWILLQERFDCLGSMNASPIHEEKQFPRNPSGKNSQKTDDLGCFEILVGRKKSEQKAWPPLFPADCYACNSRDFGPPVPGLQDRRFSLGRECSFPCGEKLEARFVDEDDRGVLPQGFFLMSGNPVVRQASTSSSRRSRAIFSGF